MSIFFMQLLDIEGRELLTANQNRTLLTKDPLECQDRELVILGGLKSVTELASVLVIRKTTFC